MDYLPLRLKVGLWITAGAALVYAFVSSRRYKTRVDDHTKSDARYVADRILSELQDRQFRDGKNDWVDVFGLGKQLGFSAVQVRAALSEFERGGQIDVVISTEKYVKLAIRGQMMRRPPGWSRPDRHRR
jgi:hypothetical protein